MSRPCVLATWLLGCAACMAWSQEAPELSYGSGFIVDSRGYVLTSQHVIAGAKAVRVVVGGRDSFPATVVSADRDHDLALLRIDAKTALPTVPLGQSTEVQRQETVLAIGFPFGESAITSTAGRIVSIRSEGVNQLLVTDATINRGNSGGPLLNDRGEAIGVIRSLRLTEIGGAPMKAGEYFAVPISFALPMLAAIPGFDWQAVGKATERLDAREIDARASPGVVQIIVEEAEVERPQAEASEDAQALAAKYTALVTSYLDRMGLHYVVDDRLNPAVVHVPEWKGDNTTLHLVARVSSRGTLLWLTLVDYLSLPADHPNLSAVLGRLMELNWALDAGAFCWVKDEGKVVLSYAFLLDNGLGYEEFSNMVASMFSNLGDKLYPELQALVANTGEAAKETE